MNKPKLKLLRPIFAYLFPMFLFALLLFTGMAMHSTLKHEKRLERQNHDQKRMQIIMNRIQTEFSLNLQVDKQFSQFLEQLQSFSDFPQVSFDNFAEVFWTNFRMILANIADCGISLSPQLQWKIQSIRFSAGKKPD